ncbi:MAG: PAS domain S-box protein [Sphingomonas sp.]
MLVLSVTDATEAAAAMAALRASEDRLAERAAVQELGVFEWDVASGEFQWSPGTEHRLGVVPGSLPNFESWRAQVHPDDIEDILDTIARVVADRADKFRYRYRFLHSNGNVRAVEGSARAIYDEEGNLVRAIGVLIDVTEREDREEALRGREAQLRSVLETVPDAMVVVGDGGMITQFSAAAEALWGYRAEDVVGRNFRILAPAEERRAYAALIADSRARQPGEMTVGIGEAADGRTFPVEIRTGIAHSEGHTLCTIFFRDISKRIEAEARLLDLNAELAHVSRQGAMSELAADLAHELNQPLAAMANFLAAARMLTERGEQSERVVEMLKMASDQTLRAGEIIRRMRDFTARGEVAMRPELIERTVREAAGLVFVGAGRFGTRVTFALDPEARMVLADRVQIQQVLVNLLRNAMQAMQGLSHRPPRSRRSPSQRSSYLTIWWKFRWATTDPAFLPSCSSNCSPASPPQRAIRVEWVLDFRSASVSSKPTAGH